MSQLVLSLSSEDLHLSDEDLDSLKEGLDERLNIVEILGMRLEPDLDIAALIGVVDPQEVLEAVHEAFDDIEIFEGVVLLSLQRYDPDDDRGLTATPIFEKQVDLETSMNSMSK